MIQKSLGGTIRRSPMQRLGTLVSLDWMTAILLVPAGIGLVISAALLALCKVQTLCGLKGRSIGAVAMVPLANATTLRRARAIRQSVSIMSRYAWVRSDCYPQALTAMGLARVLRVPYALHLGMTRAADPGVSGPKAHAWIVCDRIDLAGNNRSFQHFVSVGCWTNVDFTRLKEGKT